MNTLTKSVTASHIVKPEGRPPPFVTHSTKTKVNSVSSHNGDKMYNSSVSPSFVARKAIDLSITSTKSQHLSDTISLDNDILDSPPPIPPPPPPPVGAPPIQLESIPPPIPDSDSSSSSSSTDSSDDEKEKRRNNKVDNDEEDYPIEADDEDEKNSKNKENKDKLIPLRRESSKSPLKRVSTKSIKQFTPIKLIPKIDDSEFLSDLQKYNKIISSFSQQLDNLNNEFEVNKKTVIKNIENHHTELYKKYKEDVDTKIKSVEKEITSDLEERRRKATNSRTEIKKNMDLRNEKKEGSLVDIWILRMFRLYHAFIVYTASFIYILIIVPYIKIKKSCSKSDGRDKSQK